MASAAASVHFAPRSGESWRDPFGMYASLRERDPVHFVEDGGYWVLSRYADVASAATDTRTFSSAGGLTPFPGEDERQLVAAFAPMVMLDPPDHTAFRRLVSRGFQPRHVVSIEPVVRSFVRSRLASLSPSGEVDIVSTLLKPLPSLVVAHYLGVPEADRHRFDGWTDAIVAATAVGAPGQAATAAIELMQYFSELIETRRVSPGDDTISHLVQAADPADPDAGPSVLRMLGFCFTMVTGGNDTSTGLLGGACELLAADRQAQAALASDPALIPAAVEEFLRLTSPVQGLARTTTSEVVLHGRTIPPGAKVMLLYAAANRDPAEFGADAESLRMDRNPGRILTFSHGAHHCLGAAAARLMARVTLEEMLALYPTFTVDAASGRFAAGNFVRRYESLPWRASA